MPHIAPSVGRTRPPGAEPVRHNARMASPGSAAADRPTPAREHDSSPYVELDRAAWAALGAATEQPLTAEEVERVRGLGDWLDLAEVEQVYLPLSRLLSLYVEGAGALHRAQEDFLTEAAAGAESRPQPPRTPFVIGVAGSVAVGESTTARGRRWEERCVG